MHISSVTPRHEAAASNSKTTPKHEDAPAESTTPKKVDNVKLSEKAKDMAAQKAGERNVEEAKESLSSKIREGAEE